MSSITIELSDNQLNLIKKKADQLGISIEKLIEVTINESVNIPTRDFTQVADYVMTKNDDLYKRLA